ncbi:hypothetical protein A2U01_0025922, partial [Trifolium medium]|nr:hypothetical protein [Trifolium medium]
MEGINRRLCSNIWGSDDFEFVVKDAEGRAGGILMVWNKNSFILQAVSILEYAILVRGIWVKDNVQ